MRDAGIVKIYRLENTSSSGMMPKDRLVPLSIDGIELDWQYENRVIGYNRQYTAQGVGERVDKLIRIEDAPMIRIGMYAILTDYDGQENPEGDQYRIDNVQSLKDDDGLKATDLTLYRLDELYEITAGQP